MSKNYLDLAPTEQLVVDHALEELMVMTRDVASQSDLQLHSQVPYRLLLTQVPGRGFCYSWDPEYFGASRYCKDLDCTGLGSYGNRMYSVHMQEVVYFGSLHGLHIGLGYSGSLRASESDIGLEHLDSLNGFHVGFLLDSGNFEHCVVPVHVLCCLQYAHLC
jgi:hypothetical protein